MHKLAVIVAPLSLLACGSEPPVTHSVRVEQATGCGNCSQTSSTLSEGIVFEVDDGRLALFTDFAVDGSHTAMLEIVGVDRPEPEVRYHEISDGRISLEGEVDRADVSIRRISEEARVEGTLALEVHDGDVRRSYPNIRVQPLDAVSAPVGGSGGGGASGGGHGGSTHVVVVVPSQRTYVDSGGCEGDTTTDSGGCEGDTTTDPGGCEGDTSSSSGGCEGDTSSSSGGCEGDTSSSASGCDGGSSASGCEGDVAARSAVPGLFRLGWPIVTVAAWNRRRRRRLDA